MVQSVLFENLPYTSKKHTFRNREETVNSNVLVFKNSRIGIGTQDPEENYRVTISGNTVIRGTLTAEILSYTASNLNHLTIDNLGTQEGINLIQRGYDPFITFRSNESGIVDIIDGKGNVGIGTSIAYESLVVQGKVVAKDLLLTGESIYQKPLQVPPIHQTFIVQDRADLDFIVSTDGIYAASNEDVEVYLNGYKLAYYNSNLKDYVVSYSNEYNPPKTYFNITLTSVARSQDVIDITFWPKTLDQVQGTLGGYSTQSIYSYWDRALDGSVYYSGNVGIGTYKPISKLDVRGRITGTEFYGSGAGLSNVPGAFEKINQYDGIYLFGNIGIGTTYPREKLDVIGNIFSSGSIVCSNINALGTFNVLNTISSNTNRMVIENTNTSTALRVLQTGFDYPIALFEKGSNELAMIITPTGKVGIGTHTPLEVLDVRGNLYVSGNISCSNISTIGEFTTITTATNQTEQLIVVNAGTSTAFTVTQNGYTKVAEFFRNNVSLFQVANDGNVGIGTNSPVQKLDVRGNILTSNLLLAGPNGSITTQPTATLNLQAGKIVVSSDLLPSLCNVYNLGSSNYRFKDLYLSGNTIDLDGTRIQKDASTGGVQIVNPQGVSLDLNTKAIYTSNIGIGTNQTQVSLEIWSSNAVLLPKGTTTERPNGTPGYIRYNTDLNTFEGYSLQWNAFGGISPWSSNEKDTFYINGNVGIGTTLPMETLHVIGNTKVSGSNESTYINTSVLNVSQSVNLLNGSMVVSNGSIGIGTTTPSQSLDVNGNVFVRENLSITNNTTLLGNLGVGTLTPAEKLDVRGNIYSSGTITCSNLSIIGDFVTLNTVTSNTEQLVIENLGTGPALKVTQTGVNTLAEFYDKESGIALYINNGGNIGIGTNVTTAKLYVAGQIYATENITAFSDANYKTNIQRIPNALEKISNVHGYTFNKLSDPTGKSYMGVLAQEVETVFPELIEKQGNTLSVAYGNMVAPLIEMIHELKQRVEVLESFLKKNE